MATSRKRSTTGGRPKALSKAEANSINRRLFETSLDLIVVTDKRGTLIQISPSALSILGYQPDEVIGQDAGNLLHPDDLELTRQQMRLARRGGQTRNFECRYMHKDGHAVPLSWTGVWSEQDQHHFFIGRDMTEAQRIEAQLRQAQKMEAVGQLTGGLAHDFNNILMIILANIEMIEEEHDPSTDLRERLADIAGAVQRASDLTRHLLAFSRRQPLRPQATNLNSLVAGMGKLLQRSLGEQVRIDLKLAGDLSTTSVDPAQFEAALLNLCVNARDAMPDGGRLLIETANVVLDQDYAGHNDEVAAGAYAMLAVTDTGHGMPKNIVDKVFEPFFTTKGVGKGSGLGPQHGLWLHQAVQGPHQDLQRAGPRHDDQDLPAADRRGRGAHAPGDGGAGAARNGEHPAGRGRPGGPRQRAVATAQPRLHGDRSHQRRGGAHADGGRRLRRDRERHGHAGRRNGLMVLEEAARRWPNVGTILMSGYTENAMIQAGRLPHHVHLLIKPFTKLALARTLRQAIEADEPP